MPFRKRTGKLAGRFKLKKDDEPKGSGGKSGGASKGGDQVPKELYEFSQKATDSDVLDRLLNRTIREMKIKERYGTDKEILLNQVVSDFFYRPPYKGSRQLLKKRIIELLAPDYSKISFKEQMEIRRQAEIIINELQQKLQVTK